MVPIVTGAFDLSIGYGLGLAHVMVMQLVVNVGWPWPLACLAVIGGGAVVGVLNGVIVEFGRIDSFIATLGTGSMMYAVTGWITGGGRIVPGPQGLPTAFTDIYDSRFLGLPVPACYVLALAVVLWLVLERLPLGRYLYVVGSNPRAADLVGIPTRRYSVYAFAASGLIVGFAGVLLAAQQQIGNPSVGLDYLLPAFVGALLGSTAIKPGRPNAMGTLVAVAVLAVGLTGIGQMGADFWTVPLFYGGTLLIAVGLAGYSARRLRTGTVAARDSPAVPPEPPSAPKQDGGAAGASP
jgi:ribose transport system permease protein